MTNLEESDLIVLLETMRDFKWNGAFDLSPYNRDLLNDAISMLRQQQARIKELDAQLVYAEEENTALQIEIDKLQNELDLQLACAEEENADLQIRIEKLEAELYGF